MSYELEGTITYNSQFITLNWWKRLRKGEIGYCTGIAHRL